METAAAAGDGSPAAGKLGQQTGRKRWRWLGLGISVAGAWRGGERDRKRGEERVGRRTVEKKGWPLPLYRQGIEEREGRAVVLEELWPGTAGEGGKREEAGVRLRNASLRALVPSLSFLDREKKEMVHEHVRLAYNQN